MANIVKNFIEYAGLADQLPYLPTPSSFKQLSVMETVCLPSMKPDIEQIVKVMVDVMITNTHIVKTPKAKSLEGQNLTGKKLIVEGMVRQKIEYIADVPEQAVHAAHFDVPFSAFIILPSDFTIGTPVIVTGYIEDIYAQQVGKRCIFKNITMLLVVE